MKPVHVVLAIALLTAAFLAANHWRGPSATSPTTTAAAPENDGIARGVRRARNEGIEAPASAAEPSAVPAPAAAGNAALQLAAERTVQDLAAVASGIDPQLRDRNLIAPRRANDGPDGPAFLELQSQFDAETADPGWSSAAEARILGRISQIDGLELVSLNAECRATICRVKLFHPPGTKMRSSLDALKLPADEIGFGDATEVATLGDDGVPISVLYLQRKGA